MSKPWKLTDELTFSSISTSEVARQRLQRDSANIGSMRIKEIHLERSAGTGTISFTLRIYDAAASGKVRLEKSLSLEASGAAAFNSQGGYDVLLETGAWPTVLAASGSGHEVKLVVTYGNARDF